MADNLGGIKKILFGKSDKTTKTDDLIDALSGSILNKDAVNYADLIKSHITAAITSDSKEISNTFDVSTITDIQNRDRIRRYQMADDICDNITYASSALDVITDEVVSPDDITKESIQIVEPRVKIKSDEDQEDDYEYIRYINKEINIDSKVSDIVYNTLKYGDYFVEVCDFQSEEVPVTQALLSESEKLDSKKEKEIKECIHFEENSLFFSDFPNNKVLNSAFDLELDVLTDVTKDIDLSIPKSTKDEKKENIPLQNIRLILHDPAYVIKIQSARFRTCLGYLVLPRFSNQINPLINSTGLNTGNTNTLNNTGIYSTYPMVGAGIPTGIERLYAILSQSLVKYIGSKDIKFEKPEILSILQRIVKEIRISNENRLLVRFVPPDRMEHFVIKNQRFFPYGESIFYKCFFQAKLLILQEVALAMKRMSDSVDKRVFYVETGLPRNTRNLIESIKQAVKKRKYSLDTFGSISSIPSMITSYEDIFIPQSKGKRFVEIEAINPTTAVRELSDELKFYRDMLVAGLGVPPSYIGLEENNPNKANLSQQSVIFARIVVATQKIFSFHLFNLFSKIYMFCRRRAMPNVSITLPPPKLLQTEIQAEHVRTASEVINTLDDLGIPKDFTKKKYLSFDWNELEEYETKDKLEQKLSPEEGQEDEIGAGPSGGPTF